jgi:hypothetical protein
MSEVRMAHPDLRNPFEEEEIGRDQGATVLYGEQTVEVDTGPGEPGLWVTPADLTRINGFVLKPQGACFDQLCIPVKEGSALLKSEAGESWFNVAAFADLLEQPYVVDEETNTWSFGEIPLKREAMMTDAQAPAFELVDRQGKVVRMADFKGKKALVMTWSSW